MEATTNNNTTEDSNTTAQVDATTNESKVNDDHNKITEGVDAVVAVGDVIEKSVEQQQSSSQAPVVITEKVEKPAAQPAPVVAIDSARNQVKKLIDNKELDDIAASSLQATFRENETLKEKVSKLKALLGRSAKAQRESKVELDTTLKKLDVVQKENEKLKIKIDKLASRPTHMELLADFETNFDRALLSVSKSSSSQTGGQDTASTSQSSSGKNNNNESNNKDRNSIFDTNTIDNINNKGAVVDSLLMQELNESKQRIEKLEKLNNTLVSRSTQLENDLKESKKSLDELINKLSRLELEKRMAIMECDNAKKSQNELHKSLLEMQLEIDLVTKSAQKAAVRAAHDEEIIKNVKSDTKHISQLEDKVKILQEWAIACNNAKTIAQERVRILENQLKKYKNNYNNENEIGINDGSGTDNNKVSSLSSSERIVTTKKASMVIGAGDTGCKAIILESDLAKSINPLTERVMLRWTFDLTHDDADIVFSIYKGQCEDNWKSADILIKERLVKGGAGGEIENAFSIGRACTLVWSNKKSWIRPKTVKYTLQIVVITD